MLSLDQGDSFNLIYHFHFRALIAGGGAPEIELSLKLTKYADTVSGVDAYCFR